MKKLIAILLIGILLIVGISYHIVGFSLNKYKDFEQTNVLEYYHKYDDFIYTSEKDMENENFKKLMPMVYDFFELLPDTTIREFEEKNWKIIISSEKPSYVKEIENDVNYKVGGNAEYNLRLIFLYLNNNAPEYLLSDFIHEFGHYEDWENGLVAKSSSFEKIFKKNQGYVPNDSFSDENYHLSNTREFFACCYKDYFLYNDELKNEAPEVYNYLGSIIWHNNSNFKSFYIRVLNYF